MNPMLEQFIGCDAPYAEADIVLFGAPFDSTTSFRPGTRFGAKAMRQESFGLETYSPYLDKELTDYQICDVGDLELPFGSTERTLQQIEDTAREILSDGKRPCMLGGEHLLTLGAVRATLEKYPDLHILHLDAHTDLREDYLGEKLSHATVMRRIWELIGDHKLYQFGIRSGEREEFFWAKEHTHLTPFTLDGIEEAITALKGKPVYFSLDLDVLDPSIFPGTGTPEAGSVSFEALRRAMALLGHCNVVAMDVMELCPVYDPTGVSTAVACKVLRELLLSVGQ